MDTFNVNYNHFNTQKGGFPYGNIIHNLEQAKFKILSLPPKAGNASTVYLSENVTLALKFRPIPKIAIDEGNSLRIVGTDHPDYAVLVHSPERYHRIQVHISKFFCNCLILFSNQE